MLDADVLDAGHTGQLRRDIFKLLLDANHCMVRPRHGDLRGRTPVDDALAKLTAEAVQSNRERR